MQLSNSLVPRSSASSGYLLRQYGGAAAAYSLQRLDTSSENVVRVRRSTDDAEADFTAQEVSGGSLREFALNNDADLIRFANQAEATDKRMYFDGVNDYVQFDAFNLDAAVIRFTYLQTAGEQQILQINDNANSGHLLAVTLNPSSGDLTFRVADIATNTTQSNFFAASVSSDEMHEVVLTMGAGGTSIASVTLDGVSLPSGGSGRTQASATANQLHLGIREDGNFPYAGIIADFSVDGLHQWNGYGNTNGDWEDQVGSNDGTVVGSPALFSGQGFDAFVTTLYDQSGALGQPLSRFAQHATAADTRMQFDGTDDYITVSGMTAAGDYFGACTIQAEIYLDTPSGTNCVWSLGGAAYRLTTFSNKWYINNTNTAVSTTGGKQTVAVDFDASGQGTELRINGITVWTGTVAASTATTLFYVGARDGGLDTFQGLIYDFSITGSAVKNFAFNGYGNTNADWTDQVGSNDGTVNGSPSIYEGRNALQSTASSQPQIVADGVVVTDGSGNECIDFDGTDDILRLPDNTFGTGNNPQTTYMVYKNDTVAARQIIFSQGNNNLTTDAWSAQSPDSAGGSILHNIAFTSLTNHGSADTAWHMTLMGNDSLGYSGLDGGTVSSTVLSNTLNKSGKSCAIGNFGNPAIAPFNGKFHALIAYDSTPTTALNAAIYSSYKNTVGKNLGLP